MTSKKLALFKDLAAQWQQQRNPLSSNAWDNVLNPGYQRIIGMGTDAVPFILRKLQDELKKGEPDDWFIALWAMESRGNIIGHPMFRENIRSLPSSGLIKHVVTKYAQTGAKSAAMKKLSSTRTVTDS
jgi:hypothetical protein